MYHLKNKKTLAICLSISILIGIIITASMPALIDHYMLTNYQHVEINQVYTQPPGQLFILSGQLYSLIDTTTLSGHTGDVTAYPDERFNCNGPGDPTRYYSGAFYISTMTAAPTPTEPFPTVTLKLNARRIFGC